VGQVLISLSRPELPVYCLVTSCVRVLSAVPLSGAGAFTAGLLLHPGHGTAGSLLLDVAVHGLHEGTLRGQQCCWQSMVDQQSGSMFHLWSITVTVRKLHDRKLRCMQPAVQALTSSNLL
jgi:hypothetical protein